MIAKLAPPKPMSLPPSTPVDLVLGAYQPCYEIGSGGMASVYIAREHGVSGLQRTVALKVMHEHLAKQDQFRKRFLDEARVLTHIAHPYVCRVLGFGEEARRPYMAMEYLVGEPLSRILRAMHRRKEAISTATRARLFARAIADMAEGLHAAHEVKDSAGRPMGVVHRDVTPQNLFALYDGTVRVLDFGIARYDDRQVHTRTTGHLFGKVPYLAPEQIMGEHYDRRIDIWALGVVLWELVTLERLFKRDSEMATMRAICSDPIPRVSELVRDVPGGLDAIVARALDRNPATRYETAQQLARALELWLAKTGDPVTHADLSEFLHGFFPGSEDERRRWAESSAPPPSSYEDETTVSTPRPNRSGQRPKVETERLARPSATGRGRQDEVTVAAVPRLVEDPPTRPVMGAAARERFDLQREPHLETVVPDEPTRPLTRQIRPKRRNASGLAAWVVGSGSLGLVVAAGLAVPPRHAPHGAVTTLPAAVAAVPRLEALHQRIELPEGLFRLVLLDPKADETTRPIARSSFAPPPAPQEERPTATTGDVLIVSARPESRVEVYHGDRLLGTTPVRARLPAGTVALGVKMPEGGPRVPLSAHVAPGRVSVITVRAGD